MLNLLRKFFIQLFFMLLIISNANAITFNFKDADIKDGGTPGPGTVNCPVKYRPFIFLLLIFGLKIEVWNNVLASPYALPLYEL